MIDPREKKLAELLVKYSANVQPGELVEVRGTPLAEGLLKEVYRQVLRRGGHPLLFIDLPETDTIFYKEASEEQLTFISPVTRMLINDFDAGIYIGAESNTRSLNLSDPEKMSKRRSVHKDLFEHSMQRAADGDYKWVYTEYPTYSAAQEADMDLESYADFLYSACFCDQEDPVKLWQNVHDRQEKLVNWLKDKKNVHVKGPHVDLELSIEGRTFINSDGKENMPCGEIFTGPIEDSAEGWVRFTYPAI
nr:aminopeptidase [Anaerolineaceae bacterium]